MVFPRLLCSTAVVGLMVPAQSYAQDTGRDTGQASGQNTPQERRASEPQRELRDDEELVVTAGRLRGQVDTDVAPVLVLEEADIAAYGAGSIADLLTAIEPQTSSSRGRGGGRPIFLINGVRVGSFREFRSYPPEAVKKVEVLPEEVAQKFGYSPNRRVVNIILHDNYSALTVEAEYEQPGIGGYTRTEQEASLVKITKGGRINLNVELTDVSMLTESERDLVQTPGSEPDVATDPDPAEFRSLFADSAQIEASANYAKAFLESGSSIGLNATFNRSDARSLAGLNTVTLADGIGPNANTAVRTFDPDNPLERRVRTDTYSSSFSYNQPIGGFQFTATSDGSFADSRTEIDRRADVSALITDAAAGIFPIDGANPTQPDAGFDIARSKTYAVTNKATLRGAPLYLPAGELSTTFDVGYDWTRVESADTRSGTAVQLTRGDLSGGVNVTVPITSKRDEVWDALGTISLSGQAGFNNYSDFGTLYRWTGSVSWKPFDALDLQATYVWREVPPSLSQLGSPQVTSFNVPTFDLTTGDTVLVDVTSGGNPNLLAETQSDWSFSANWEFVDNARFRIDYSRNKSDNVSSSYPFLTPEIEAAFPGRVTRDAGGVLTAIDRRPVDYFETRTERVTFGLNFRGSFGKARPQEEAPPAAAQTQGRPAGARGAGRGPGGSEGGGRRAAFMQFREKLCADDGEAFLLRLVDAIEKGQPFDEITGFSPERAERMLSRVRNEDGTINKERLAEFRTRMCNREGGPPQRGTGPGNGPANGQANGQERSRGERPRGGPNFANMTDEQREAFMAFRTRVCADDGEAFLLRFAEAVGRGESLEELPNFDMERAQRMLARLRGEDGAIDPEKLKQFRTRMCSGQGAGRQSGRAGGRARGGRGFGRRGGDGRGRFFFNLSHGVELNREILIAPGGPQLDLLDGDSLSATGTPRHTTRIFAGAFRGGFGTRASVFYSSKARIDGTGGATDLFVGDLATVNLRVFADLGAVFKAEKGVFKGMRASFRLDNVFDTRRTIRDGNGDIPVSFQPLRLDPIGRYVGMEIRKVF